MKKSGCSRWGWWGGLFVIAMLCIVGIALYYFQARAIAFNSRPLVLIHSPINHEQVGLGEGVLVHATARSAHGVSRVEFWADGSLLTVQEHPESGPLSPLVLNTDWQVDSPGSHILLVRAVSADGIEGQAAITVEVAGEEEAALGGHIVQEGETPESIAEQYDVSLEEIADLNPGVDVGGITPGDELIIPGGSGAGEGEPSPEDGEEPAPVAGDEAPPDPLAPAPGLELTLLGFFFPNLADNSASADPVPLRVEVLSLETGATYERLHCYVGMTGNPPRWVPDADFDQTTDESFAALGEGVWNVGEYLSGEAAPIVTWPGNQPISLSANCVGILGGGTDAVQLGQLLLEVPPVEWDGVARWSAEVNSEGSFRLEYRIGSSTGQGHGIPIYLDPTMTSPTDLQLAPRGFSLTWNYNPRTDPPEETIDGFRIYLNDTLQWVEPPDARLTNLPHEWLYPPCGESYTFEVTAFREGFPDGPESMPTEPPVIIEPDPDNCQRKITVTFLTLTTYFLGGDGRYEDRSGDVGPVYGYFYANDQRINFDGQAEGYGLSHGAQYDISSDLTAAPGWGGSGPAVIQVELAEDEPLTLGYQIKDQDTGRCHDSGDRGCDDVVCESSATYQYDQLGVSQEGGMGSSVLSHGQCDVSYTLGLISGSPAGEPGEIPLPWLTVEDLKMAEASQIRIKVRNSGTASWPSRRVTVALTRPDGEIINRLPWADIDLAPGDTTTLQSGTINYDFSSPICVILDPDNEVLEKAENERMPVDACLELPDLRVTNVEYDAPEERLLITVRNLGEGSLENRTVGLSIQPPGGPPAPSGQFPGTPTTLRQGETTVLTWPMTASVHSQLAQWSDGYVMTVDPDNTIEESNNENNTLAVPGMAHLRLTWTYIEAPYAARNKAEYQLFAKIISGGSQRTVMDWSIGQDIDWTGYCARDQGCLSSFLNNEYDISFDIAGDESLQVTAFVTHKRYLEDDFGHKFNWMGEAATYGVGNGWGAGSLDAIRSCTRVTEGPGYHMWILGYYGETFYGYADWQPWMISFNICREDVGE